MKSVYIIRSNAVNPDPRVEKIADFLKENYKINIWAWDRDNNSKKEDYILQTIPIIRFGPKSKFGTGIKGIFALIIWQFTLFFKLLYHRKKIDIIHACDMDTVIPAFVVTKIFKKKLVYDMFDHYAYSRVFPKVLEKLICKFEDFFSTNSDGLILVDDVRKEQLTKINSNTTIIYNSPYNVLLNTINTIVPNSISYVGILQPHRFLLELIDIIKQQKKWTLKIAGFGLLETEILKKISADTYNTSIDYLGKVDYKTGLIQSANCEVMVAIYDPTIPNHKYASPNKYFEALMLGKIIIACRDSHIDKEIINENIGFVFNYNNPNEFCSILEKIEQITSPEKKTMGERSKLLYEKKYSPNIQKEKLLLLYTKI